MADTTAVRIDIYLGIENKDERKNLAQKLRPVIDTFCSAWDPHYIYNLASTYSEDGWTIVNARVDKKIFDDVFWYLSLCAEEDRIAGFFVDNVWHGNSDFDRD